MQSINRKFYFIVIIITFSGGESVNFARGERIHVAWGKSTKIEFVG